MTYHDPLPDALHEADLVLLPLAQDICDGEALLALPEAAKLLDLSENPSEACASLGPPQAPLRRCAEALLAVAGHPALGCRQFGHIPRGSYLAACNQFDCLAAWDPMALAGCADAFLGVLADLAAGRVAPGEEALGVATSLLELIPPPLAALFADVLSGEFGGFGTAVADEVTAPLDEEDGR